MCLLEDNMPYSSRQAQTGFDLDTAQAIATRLERHLAPIWVKNAATIVEIDDSDFPLRRLARHECDAIFSMPGPATDTLRDAPQLALGAAYYGAGFELIATAAGAPSNLHALGSAVLAIQAQTIANFALDALRAQYRTYFSTASALQSVVAAETTAALLWGPAAGWALRQQPASPLSFVSGYEPPRALRWNEHVATRKIDTELRERIDTLLAELSASGQLREIAARYGIPYHSPFATTYSPAELQKLR